ncbi:MAG: SusC/RagA family TonB-linked outer membrane protein, partial [Bacteroidales bacterium]|nr:SusC/RagA family TonB-linked outer membrane protein [Bacteroidales bacterium]
AGATSTSSAESTVTKNIGTISTHGIEIETDIDLYRNRDWNINLGLNATFMKNKVVKLPIQNRKNGILNGTKKIVEGKDIYSYYLYTFEGVDMLDGQSLYKFNDEDYYITSDNTATGTVLAGSPYKEDGETPNTLMAKANYKEINGKYYVNNTTYALREFHGTASPTVYGGINFNVSYKNLSLATIFSYSLGGYVYDGVYAGLMGASGTPTSIHSDAMNSWTAAPAGMTENSANRIDRNALPEFNYGTSSYNNGSSTRWLTSANYLIFKNLAINYQLPKSLAKACQMSAISVGISAENLFTLAARKGMNPQQSFSGTQSNALVTPRIITGQINFKF